MNNVILIGRTTKDLELTNGACKFTLAVGRTYKNKSGEYDTDFINCVAFNTIAENMVKFVKKGHLVAIDGRIQVSMYEKDGYKNYNTEVIADKVSFLQSNQSTEEK